MFLIATIINFPLLTNESFNIEANWWWIWFIWIFIWSKLLWGQPTAVKWIYLWTTLLVLWWIAVSFNLHTKTPKLKFELDENKPNEKPTETKSNKNTWDTSIKKWSFIKDTIFGIFGIGNNNSIEDEFEEEYQEKWKSNSKSKKQITKKEKLPEEIIEEKEELTNDNKAINKEEIKNRIRARVKAQMDEQEIQQIRLMFSDDKPTFDIDLLDESPDPDNYKIDESYLENKANAVLSKLSEFGIEVEKEWFNIWPTVIQIKIKPWDWIRVSQIESLKKDLELALRTKSLRVIAPIPWTDSVWIEIPNPKPVMVRIRDILASNKFTKEMWDNYTNLSLGKWIDWETVIKSLEKMPHLLVAWATWSWKSVWINDFILSLIFQNSPSELKFIMVDPKQVELWMYDWIPYLLSPIITEPDKALKVLKWATLEMDRRYNQLKSIKVRNIDEYNDKKPDEKMYKIVIIIDELADLMMSGNKKDTENAIARIAQKARAVWIHLIVATQRPSVNVITWLIKANIPTRIAFWVVSQIDSRTILDTKWAEDLVWKWDLLYIDPNNKFPVRIQAPFVSTAETEKVVEEIKAKYMNWIEENQIYHPEIINILENKIDRTSWDDISSDDEELLEQAIQIIIETRKASATLLQRKLGIGFPRAARIIDILEQKGIIWPQDGAKPREIFIS